MKRQEFLNIFDGIKDPRIERTKLHPLESILGLGLLGAMAGITSFLGLQDFADMHQEELDKIIPFPKGIPSHDTIGRVFSQIDVDAFHTAFFDFTESIKEQIKGIVSIDGKTMRNSHAEKPLHIVSAWSEANKLVLGQVRVASKSNEITAIPKVLDMLDLVDQIVTVDAMGCQKKIAQKVIDKKGDYLLALKGNQKNLHEDVKTCFEDEEMLKAMNHWEELDKGHGRIEKRQCWVTSKIDWLNKLHEWPNLTTIAMVKCKRILKNKATFDTRYYISSLPENAEVFCKAARGHWGIENKLHWCLDVVLNEDKCMIRNDNAPEIMGMMRKWALNIHNKTKAESMSLKRSFARCGMSIKHLFATIDKI